MSQCCQTRAVLSLYHSKPIVDEINVWGERVSREEEPTGETSRYCKLESDY